MDTWDDKSYMNSMGTRSSFSLSLCHPPRSHQSKAFGPDALLTSYVTVSGMSDHTQPRPWEMLVIPDFQRPMIPSTGLALGILHGHYAT